jgi:methylenetetrahydrofolate reductase (NADPH)
LWIDDWANIYETKSESYKLLNEVYNTYYLVNIVDNNFVDGDILKHILSS